MSDPLDDTLPALSEESSHLKTHPGFGRDTSYYWYAIYISTQLIPADFHVVVKADGAEYQTSNKSVNVDQAIVEWHKHIVLLCDLSFKVRVSMYASFELGPMVCHGELLHMIEISIKELLDHSEKSHSMIFQSKQEEVIVDEECEGFGKFLWNFPALVRKVLPKFPTLFQKSFGLSLDIILKLRAHTWVRSAAHELKPSPFELVLPFVHGVETHASHGVI
ncbi:uncharacterized protein F5891DRAFT_1180310 [Suillus fuscotomentosus]|uniref:Uncharacterized protein n=1 Tax=Suillus fuscotomentosus TaxID=1912939 RepID=A0AAD4EMD3_9AGAM|nr:uncharacterized protein F5891DRAFT_1180310 [Suillus fuscotomentosus]KAG1908765.1 hypothetical protein F5891DRAFT_1180310 [Suillus fuscotomentosus]